MSRRHRRIEPFAVQITALRPGSLGWGQNEGEPVVVRGAPPGAVVIAQPFQKKAGVIHARRGALVQAPPDAVAPRCALFTLCGGCSLQEIPLTTQRAAKQAMVETLLGDLSGVTVSPVAGEPEGYAYRNKVELSFGARRYVSEGDRAAGAPDEGRFLGFHAPGRFDKVVDAPRCELVSEGLNALIQSARGLLERSALPPWDARALQGFWRHLVLRESWAGGRLVGIYTSPPPAGQEAVAEAELQAWAEGLPEDVVAAWYVNPRTGDAAVGDLRAALKGEPALIERIGDVAFRLSPTAFFQTNTPAARALYERVGEALGLVPGARRDARLVDLYCGAGAIGLSLASRVREVLGVELNPEAVNDARVNAALNNIPATFIAGAVEDVLPALGADDLAVVDPPRAGLHPKASAWLAKQRCAALVYVACNPESLARDRQLLAAGGWRMTALWGVDLFPQTGHVELVARFERVHEAGQPSEAE